MIALLFLLTACAPQTVTLDSGIVDEPTEETEQNVHKPGGNAPGGTDEIILNEGTWDLSAPALTYDSCGVNGYQEVSEFVPANLTIENSDADSFRLLPDDLLCERDGLDFYCESLSLSEEALAGTASMQILSAISGTVVSEDNFDMVFDVTIESCEGSGCFLIELALTFPCPVTLNTNGSN